MAVKVPRYESIAFYYIGALQYPVFLLVTTKISAMFKYE